MRKPYKSRWNIQSAQLAAGKLLCNKTPGDWRWTITEIRWNKKLVRTVVSISSLAQNVRYSLTGVI